MALWAASLSIAPATLAVATSTGGIFNKLPGRVGDSPLIGCGTYADDARRGVVHRVTAKRLFAWCWRKARLIF